jgi:hypothetical protein
MKKIILLIFTVLLVNVSFGQYIKNNQSYNWTKKQIFSGDSLKFTGIYGTGTILKIDANNNVYIGSGIQDTLVDTSQVVDLNKYLNLKQDLISVDSNFVFTGNKIYLNDTIWTEVGRFSNRVRIKSTLPILEINETDASADNKIWHFRSQSGNLRIQAITDAGSGSGDFIDFTRSSNNITSFRLLDNAAATIKLKNSGTGVFEDTVRTGQLKASGLLYPLSDGANGQVIRTEGEGVLSFANVGSLLTGGTDISISNDTISYTGSAGTNFWTQNGTTIYNNVANVAIGDTVALYPFHVRTQMRVTSGTNPPLTVENTAFSTPALDIISNLGAGVKITSNPAFSGYALKINGVDVDSVSTDTLLNSSSNVHIPTEYAVKKYVDFENNKQKLGELDDVDTTARANNYILKWNSGTRKYFHTPDTIGGGGGSTVVAGDGLTASGDTLLVAPSGIVTSMIQNDAITYSKIQNVGGNSILARAASGSGNLSEVSLSANRLLGRGNTGNVSAISLSGLSMSGTVLTNPYTGTVTNIASGNGMSFSSITTLTGTTTNSVGVGTHAHALDFTTFQSNTRTFYLDTARVVDDLLSDGKVAITNQEKVVSFTLSRNADSVRLDAGYYTVHGMVDIEVRNDDTTAGVAGFFQNYQLNAFVTEGAQALGRGLSGTTTVLETAETNATPMSSTDADGSPKEGTIRLHLVTTPVKFYLGRNQFIALTIKATYPSPADFVSHKRATMIINRVVDFDESKEQIPDITED